MSLLLAAALQAAALPAAAIADPPRDAARPARNAQLLVPSHGAGMNALLFHASGAGPKPLVVLLHGLPGNERDLDLAQAIRRAGWSVLASSYRGAFGSPGRFPIAHAAEDVDAALASLRVRGIAAKHRVDPQRIVLGGHSMGAFAAALRARGDRGLAGVMLLDAANLGKRGARLRADGVPLGKVAAGFDDLGDILAGASPATLAAEVLDAPPAWDLHHDVAAMHLTPLLAIRASEALAADTAEIAAAARREGDSRVTAATMTTDHGFADHHIALAGAVVGRPAARGR